MARSRDDLAAALLIARRRLEAADLRYERTPAHLRVNAFKLLDEIARRAVEVSTLESQLAEYDKHEAQIA